MTRTFEEWREKHGADTIEGHYAQPEKEVDDDEEET
jgi:hypothetical protein